MTKTISPETAAALDAEADDILAATPPAKPDDSKAVTDLVVIERTKIKWADTTAGGQPKQTMTNAMQCIDGLGLICEQNVFSGKYTVNGSSLQTFNGDLSDVITRKIRDLSRAYFGLDPGTEATLDAMKRICEENRFHPLVNYLTSLKWDGVQRLDQWLTTYLSVADTPLVRAQGRIAIMAAVRRIFEPGCKFDSVLVLEGPEGVFKSSVVKVLANGSRIGNEYFSDSPILNTEERKQQELTAGVWFYELAELAGMKKAEQFAVKNFITKQEERARPAYGHFQEIKPRVCVFIGTFNTAPGGELIQYLNAGDQRRWWPVLVGNIDIPGLERDRDQLFAEAMFEYELGGERDLYLPPALEAEAKRMAATREKIDPLADTLSTIYRDVLRMRQPIADESVMLTADSKPVTRLETDAGIMLTKGEEAEPFAMYDPTSGGVWVSSKYVGELVPPARKSDGPGIGSAMRSLGWASVEDRRTGNKHRGWVFEVPDPTG
jgi:predicted P-loop ATPase